MRWIVPVCALAALVAPASAQPDTGSAAPGPGAAVFTEPLTLERAIQIGLQNQNTLAIAEIQVEAARQRVTQSRAAYYPQIAPTFEYNNQLTTLNTGQGRRTGTFEQSVTQIGLRQTLFDMGKREQNVALSRSSQRATEYNLLDTRQAVILNVTMNWYELLRHNDLVRVAEASAARARTTLEATQAFVEAGATARKDILQAQADFDNAQVQVIQARNAVRLGESSLKNAMGITSPQRVTLPDTPLPRPADAADTRQIAEYVQIAYDRRPDLKREAANIEANRRNVKIANINAGLQIQADITEGYRINPDPGENRAFTTSLSYPLFDAGASRARVREAKASEDQARQQNELTRREILVDVEQSYLLREEARQRIAATEAAVRAARINYEAATESQREGSGTIIDVITAQAQLVTAETNAVEALYDFYTAEARLRRAVGDNDPYRTPGAPDKTAAAGGKS